MFCKEPPTHSDGDIQTNAHTQIYTLSRVRHTLAASFDQKNPAGTGRFVAESHQPCEVAGLDQAWIKAFDGHLLDGLLLGENMTFRPIKA